MPSALSKVGATSTRFTGFATRPGVSLPGADHNSGTRTCSS